ncbi:MAG: hypothetical protein SGJ24_05180 [Chloroflexota bacterium]|nr:hypothetical protein [Chloroflexota bacterium]
MSEMKLLLLVHAAVTWMLVGLILTIQIVHYPLFRFVGAASYPAYQDAHMGTITALVAPLMLIELVTAVILALAPPEGVPSWATWVGLALVGLIWFATLFINSPQHAALSGGFDAATHAALVASNWIRTIAWIGRGGLMLWLLARLIAR